MKPICSRSTRALDAGPAATKVQGLWSRFIGGVATPFGALLQGGAAIWCCQSF